MSNVIEKFGLRPYRKLDGTPLVGAQNRYTIAVAMDCNIQGDLVQFHYWLVIFERHTGNTSQTLLWVFSTECFIHRSNYSKANVLKLLPRFNHTNSRRYYCLCC